MPSRLHSQSRWWGSPCAQCDYNSFRGVKSAGAAWHRGELGGELSSGVSTEPAEKSAGAAWHRGERSSGVSTEPAEKSAGAAWHRGERSSGVSTEPAEKSAGAAWHRGERSSGVSTEPAEKSAGAAWHRGERSSGASTEPAEKSEDAGYSVVIIRHRTRPKLCLATVQVELSFVSSGLWMLTGMDRILKRVMAWPYLLVPFCPTSDFSHCTRIRCLELFL
ncbi:cell surface protein [Venturia nashicola]|nr:cell surface protein [Venturia nashicola]